MELTSGRHSEWCESSCKLFFLHAAGHYAAVCLELFMANGHAPDSSEAHCSEFDAG